MFCVLDEPFTIAEEVAESKEFNFSLSLSLSLSIGVIKISEAFSGCSPRYSGVSIFSGLLSNENGLGAGSGKEGEAAMG